MPPNPDQNEQTGADRFWGQFSQSTAGRSTGGDDAPREGNAAPARESDDGCLEWCPICRSAELFRNTVSTELRQQAESIQHEAIGVLKAFLDAYAEKAGGTDPGAGGAPGHGFGPRPQGPDPDPAPPVTDIPLD